VLLKPGPDGTDAVAGPDTDIFRRFVGWAVMYVHSWLKVVRGNEEAREDLREHLQRLSEQYARLLLHTSGFEQTREDETFFSGLLALTLQVVKQSTWVLNGKRFSCVARGVKMKMKMKDGHTHTLYSQRWTMAMCGRR
jgi:hypothetical protein